MSRQASLPSPNLPARAHRVRMGTEKVRSIPYRSEMERAIAAWVRGVAALADGREVSAADLETLRDRLTLAYVQRGYVNSGVVLPDQAIDDGLVTFQAVEGRLSEIIVTAVLDKDVRAHLKESSRFWVVRPRLGAGGVSGLDSVRRIIHITTVNFEKRIGHDFPCWSVR